MRERNADAIAAMLPLLPATFHTLVSCCMSVTATPRGKSMRRYGGTLSTMGRPDKPLQSTAFGAAERQGGRREWLPHA
jgi:hypothetical protein